MSNGTPPIVVSDNPLPATLAAFLRYAVGLAGSFAVGRGYVDAESLPGITTIVVTVATVAYGIFRTHQNRKNLIKAADAAPNSVAKVVG